ncbi:MAG: DinB family protein [Candidatus Heimdallarchaeota archaeon]|nr:DinB family protein [Candidatus Heimdallarchaeota archaeon]MCK5159260.1 DinB family protein [Candidatus Heimdallarchaeota archaeon]
MTQVEKTKNPCPTKISKENSKDLLARQLGETAKIIDWAMKSVPDERLLEEPPHSTHPNASEDVKRYFGSWSAYHILFHLLHYEESAALPNLTLWLEESEQMKRRCGGEKEAYQEALMNELSLQTLLDRFHVVRKKQIDILNKITDAQWTEKRSNTNWGNVTIEFIITKSIQHTLEHGNKILRNVLFWDSHLRRLNNK